MGNFDEDVEDLRENFDLTPEEIAECEMNTESAVYESFRFGGWADYAGSME